jgi:hypothetical protein
VAAYLAAASRWPRTRSTAFFTWSAEMSDERVIHVARRDRFAAVGDGKLEFASLPRDGIEIEPVRSLLTGNQLAANEQYEIDYIDAEIGKARAEHDRLVKEARGL